MGFFNNPPKRLNIYLGAAHKIENMETLPDNKRKNVFKKVKRAVNTRWLSLHASVDGVYEEYVGLLETFSISAAEGGSDGSTAKGFSKSLTRDNLLLDPRQRLFNNFKKVQFWAKFHILAPIERGQEFSQRKHIYSRKCLISV